MIYIKGRKQIIRMNALQAEKLLTQKHQLKISLTAVIFAFTVCYLPLIGTQAFSHTNSLYYNRNPEIFDQKTHFVWTSMMYISSRLVQFTSFMFTKLTK